MPTALGAGVLPPDLNQQLQAELRPGERVAWSAQPRRRSAALASLLFLPFGAFFGGMPLLFFVLPAFGLSPFFRKHDGPPVFFGCFGMIFVVAGLALMTMPFWIIRNAARTVYAVTNQRAIILQPRGLGGVTVQTFLPDRLTGMTRTEKPDGSGGLVFEQFTERVGTGSRTVRRGFLGIDRVRDVETLITNTLLAGRVR